MPVKISVATRSTGPRNQEEDLEVELQFSDDRITVEGLIRRAVAEQVNELTVIRRLKSRDATAILRKQYLTAEKVGEQAKSGKVSLPSPESGDVAELSLEKEVSRAIQAFTKGRFAVFIDGKQLSSLKDSIELNLDTRVVFLRLVPLIGG